MDVLAGDFYSLGVRESANGLTWGSFQEVAPQLAGDVRRLIESFRFALVGTIRGDGTPRISPIETHLVRDNLMLVMIPGTRKAADIRRDDRVVVQSPITNASNPGIEFKLRGRAVSEEDEEQGNATADAIERYSGWRPRAAWLFLKIMLDDVTCIDWSTSGTALLSRWSLQKGLLTPVHLRLDMESGEYVRE